MSFEELIMAIFLAVLPTVLGCGQIITGQERTINFNLTNFILPASMAFSDDMGAPYIAPTISKTEDEAKIFVQRVVERLLQDILYQQGRSALLSDDVISLILQQLDVKVTYKPLKCDKVFMAFGAGVADVVNCLIVKNTVTNICQYMAGGNDCTMPASVELVPSEHLSISGSIKTSNIIMANWPNEMWQIIVNRVLQSLKSGPMASSFFKAIISIN